MSLLDELSLKALEDEYLKELFSKAEFLSAANFFHLEKEGFDEKELLDILRFADILSRSNDPDAKNKAYKIISLLVDSYKDSSIFLAFANSVFVKLGNFPALSFLKNKDDLTEKYSLEINFERIIKEVFQKAPKSELVFTDSQYEIFENLKNSNHYSFSGPTSLGKSFILKCFIKDLIAVEKINENIVILVPTRALINQTLLELKKEFSDIKGYRILSHPTISDAYKVQNNKYIFIFTPERLISYLSDYSNPKIGYLFIDEAQKVVADKDSRSPLYYHAILQAERKSIKLYFASPNIPNPDIFLRLFDKSIEESTSIKTSPVAQNRYFLDLVNKKCLLLSDLGVEQEIQLEFSDTEFSYWLKTLSGNQSSLIYCNTKQDTIKYALSVAATLPDKKDERIGEVISVIEEYLHKKYFLIDCLKKGIAFHFGNLPQRIREKIEVLFVDRVIDYVFCTSTLLEGVNLPAKNIFILSNAVGLSKFTDIDFWNLAGRAGRLTKELSGNIICVRAEDKKNRWDNPAKDLEVVKNKKILQVSPLIVTGTKNFYKNISSAITGKDFTRKDITANEKEIFNHYANITLIHQIRNEDSILYSSFLKNNIDAKEILEKAASENLVPERILSSYSMIKAKYQNKIYKNNNLSSMTLDSDISYVSVLKSLEMLCDFYSWEAEEEGGSNPMLPSRETLKYYAVLMSNWMNSKPLSWMIKLSIDYYKDKGEIWHANEKITFCSNNKSHVNLVINKLISDLDNIVKFKLRNYYANYYDLLFDKLGEANAGPNWAEYLEYGTTDPKIIELQNLGMPRHLASYLLSGYQQYFDFDDSYVLVKVRKENLLASMDKNSIEFKELLEVI